MSLHYKEIGEGEPVILLHGFLENHKMWLNIAEQIKGFRFILPDLLGHGATPTVNKVNTMEEQAKSVAELMRELGVGKAPVIGHSMGGYVAMAMARDYASMVSQLGLFFSKTTPDNEVKKQQRLEAVRVVQRNKKTFVKLGMRALFDQGKLSHLRKEVSLAQEWGMETPVSGIVAALKGMRERGDTTRDLVEFAKPILVILGEKDTTVEPVFAEMLPARENIHVHTLPCGHMGHLEKPHLSQKYISEFLVRNFS